MKFLAETHKLYVLPAETVPGYVVKVFHKPVLDDATALVPSIPWSQYTA
jgi:hypothetical protein